MTIEIIIASKGECKHRKYTDLTRGDGDERADER